MYTNKEGDRIGECVFLHEVEPYITPTGKKHKKALFECKCGKRFQSVISSVRLRTTKSCGCYNLENFNINRKGEKHGMHTHLLYGVWQNMKNRCYNPTMNNYKWYGEKGIEVCEEWKNSFLCFYTWAKNSGWKIGLTIDRIDIDRNYEPPNCRWATPTQQARNRSTNIVVEDNGERICLLELCERKGVNYRTVLCRIQKYHWPIDRAINTPTCRELALRTLETNPERGI